MAVHITTTHRARVARDALTRAAAIVVATVALAVAGAAAPGRPPLTTAAWADPGPTSGSGTVTFEVVPAQPTAAPSTPPPAPSASPAALPSPGGILPTTGESPWLRWQVALGALAVLIGGTLVAATRRLARRRR